MRLLARREHARAELRAKLLDWSARQASRLDPGADSARGLPAHEYDGEPGLQSVVDSVLDDLHARGLLCDERAAESLVTAKAGRFGQRRLRQLMQHRQLPEAVVSCALQSLRGSETERASEVWRKRFGTPPRDPAERARQFRFLLMRGFDAETAARAIDHGAENGPSLPSPD